MWLRGNESHVEGAGVGDSSHSYISRKCFIAVTESGVEASSLIYY